MNGGKSVIACVTAQDSCSVIIEKAAETAERTGASLEVVTAQPRREDAGRRADDMRCLDRLSKKTGRTITVLYGDRPLQSLVSYIEKKEPLHIFTGRQSGQSDFVARLSVLTGAPITMVTHNFYCTLPPMGYERGEETRRAAEEL